MYALDNLKRNLLATKDTFTIFQINQVVEGEGKRGRKELLVLISFLINASLIKL